MALHWHRAGATPRQYGLYTGAALIMYWYCTGTVLVLHKNFKDKNIV